MPARSARYRAGEYSRRPWTSPLETKARLSSDPFSELDPTSAAALKGRIDRIMPVWVEYAKLTAVHG